MSVQDITPDAVLQAVQDGHDDVFKLAEHFGVMHVSHTLRTTLYELGVSGRITQSDPDVALTRTFRVVTA